ncbi:MAG: sugar ABC transporter permease [Phycisphaerae bacterium]|nr:MAG: sugar ABC transporter permease [Phycisphaerae bacterium]
MGTPQFRRHDWSAFKLTLPWLAGVLILVVAPLIATTVLSFVHWDGIDTNGATWVGGQNYQELATIDPSVPNKQEHPWHWSLLGGRPRDALFVRSMINSLTFAIFATPLNMSVALLLALLVNAPLRGMSIFRAFAYLPHVLGGVATILIWSWIFNPTFGPINVALKTAYEMIDPLVRTFGGGGTSNWPVPGWLASEAWCKPAVICIHAWTAGGSVFIFLAALQGTDPDAHVAALLDGASRRQRFLSITLPQLTPAIFFNLVTGFVASMQSFNYSYLLYNRAQNDGLLFVVLQIYRSAFEPPYRLGYASAMACILFVTLFVFTAITAITSRKWVHYES